jgi:hypothetical protein
MTTRLTSLNNWIEGEDKIMDTFKKNSNSLNFDVENQKGSMSFAQLDSKLLQNTLLTYS